MPTISGTWGPISICQPTRNCALLMMKMMCSLLPFAKPAHLIDALTRLKRQEQHSSFSWGDGKQDYVASAHSLFLSGGFLANHWEIILSQSEGSILIVDPSISNLFSAGRISNDADCAFIKPGIYSKKPYPAQSTDGQHESHSQRGFFK